MAHSNFSTSFLKLVIVVGSREKVAAMIKSQLNSENENSSSFW